MKFLGSLSKENEFEQAKIDLTLRQIERVLESLKDWNINKYNNFKLISKI